MDYSLHLAEGNFYQGPMVNRNCTKPLSGIEAIIRSDSHGFQKSNPIPMHNSEFQFYLKKSNNCSENYSFYREAL